MPIFFAPRKLKTMVFTIYFFASNSKRIDFSVFFWLVPGKCISFTQVFSLLQEVLLPCHRYKNTVIYSVLAFGTRQQK